MTADTTPKTPDTLTVFLDSLSVLLRVGYYAHEEQAPQRVLISVALTVAALPDYRLIGRDLTQLVDYAALHDFITQQLPQAPHEAFLETIAETILQFCWRDSRIQHMRVRLQKPDIIAGAPNIGIVLERRR
jgi:7,8-dihydroneopterin aldolase/epimerase/oxygenase